MQLGHDVLTNWAHLTGLLLQIGQAHFDPLEISIVEEILKDVIAIDATGQVFRYPEDNKGKKHLVQISHINVEVLADGMKTLFDLFEHWDSGLNALLAAKQLNTSSI